MADPVLASRGVVEALKGNPLVLALVIMNLALLGLLYYNGVLAHGERQSQAQMLNENRGEMAKLFAQCNAVPERDDTKP